MIALSVAVLGVCAAVVIIAADKAVRWLADRAARMVIERDGRLIEARYA